MKQVVWLGDSLARVREFAPDARHEAGFQLGLVQAEEEPADWKPMPSVGLGVNIELARQRFKALIRERRQQ